MSRNKNKPQGVKTNNTPKPPSANADVALLGSDTIPPTVELHEGKSVTLREIVQRAQKESGLDAADWNKLTGKDRDEKLNAVINAMRLEQEPSRDEVAATNTASDDAKQALGGEHYEADSVAVEGTAVPVAEIVKRAFLNSGKSLAAWNALDNTHRKDLVDQALTEAKTEARAAAAEKEKADKAEADKQAKADKAAADAKAQADKEAEEAAKNSGGKKAYTCNWVVKIDGKKYGVDAPINLTDDEARQLGAAVSIKKKK